MRHVISLKHHLSSITDPRVIKRSKHNLVDILVLGVLAILGHAETWYEIESFGKIHITWLKKFLSLPNGIPSHDTFNRVFSLVKPIDFEIAFMDWISAIRDPVQDDILCIDGKASNGTVKLKQGRRQDVLSTVSVWSTKSGISLGQLKTKSVGSSEVEAAKALIDKIDISGCTIIGDAAIGTSSVVDKILENSGNYIFPIKANNNVLNKKLVAAFNGIAEKNSKNKKVSTCAQKEVGHGRKEYRYCTTIALNKLSEDFNLNKSNLPYLKELNTIGRVVLESFAKERRNYIRSKDIKTGISKITLTTKKIRKKKEIRYFVTNLKLPAKKLLSLIRLQWSIENKLHWILDVSFGEDDNRTRNKIAAENLAVARKIAFNLVKQDKTIKAGIRTKLKIAGWDEEFLEKIIFNSSHC